MWAYTSTLFISIISAVCIFKLDDENNDYIENNNNDDYNVDNEKPNLRRQFNPRYSKNNNYNRYNASSIHSTNSNIPPYNHISHLR
jgi:hypothetical protein